MQEFRAERRSLGTEVFGCFKCICSTRVGWDNRSTAEDAAGQSVVCDLRHTFQQRGDNVLSVSAALHRAAHKRHSVNGNQRCFFRRWGSSTHTDILGAHTWAKSVHTHSLKRRLWILVMAFEAMGLPMPELAGEPWDTGVML